MKTLIAALAASVALAGITANTATAACTPGVQLKVGTSYPATVLADGVSAQTYTYSVCAHSAPARTTVQFARVNNAKASYKDAGAITPLGPEAPLANWQTGSGQYVVPTGMAAGAYDVIVRYYAQGMSSPESEAQVRWVVSTPAPTPTPPAPTPTPTPSPDPPAGPFADPDPVPDTAPTPPTNVSTPKESTPSRGTPAPTPVIGLTKSVSRAKAKVGQRVIWTLQVRVRRATATGLRVCDRLPSGVDLVSAPKARFSNGQLCWSLGNRKAGFRTTLKVTTIARVVGTHRNVATATARNAARVTDDAVVRVSGPTVVPDTPAVTG